MKKKVLISPLDWGLGHATRVMPLIEHLDQNGVEVIVSSYGESHVFLKREFPALLHINHPGIEVNYPKNGAWMAFHFLQKLPMLHAAIRSEWRMTQEIIAEYAPDLIISDNRYGVYSEVIPSVFITHQTQIKSPLFENSVNFINHRHINRFHQCWVPDDLENSLSGELSAHGKITTPVKRIGFLSTLRSQKSESQFDFCFVVSGPEPQRTLFQQKLLRIASEMPEKNFALITNSQKNIDASANVKVFQHCKRETVHSVLLSAELIVSRPGYSTLMDLAGTHTKCLFIPTPGQTEQEYLAEELQKKNIARTVKQQELKAEHLLAEPMRGFVFAVNKDKFKDALNELLLNS